MGSSPVVKSPLLITVDKLQGVTTEEVLSQVTGGVKFFPSGRLFLPQNSTTLSNTTIVVWRVDRPSKGNKSRLTQSLTSSGSTSLLFLFGPLYSSTCILCRLNRAIGYVPCRSVY